MKHNAIFRFFTFLMLAVLAGTADVAAQQHLRVVSAYASSDPMTVPMQRRDRNNMICGMVKVIIPVEGAVFEGNVMGPAEFKTNEYWVYLNPGTKFFNIKVPGYYPMMFDFEENNLDPVAEKTIYYVTLEGDAPAAAAPARPRIDSNFLVLKVLPPDASVKVDGQMVPVEDGVAAVQLKVGEHSWEVMAVGYAPQSGRVNITSSAKSTVDVALVSQMVKLNIVTTPDAQVIVNGREQGKGSRTVELLAGLHNIELKRSGYRPYATTVELTAGSPAEVSFTDFVPVYGMLTIDYRPVGATVTIDGKSVGETPLTLNDILIGSHNVVIAANGYTSRTERVTVSETTPSNLRGSLEKPASATPATPARPAADSRWSTTPINFALCATRDGTVYYITQSQWKALSASEQSAFDKKGVYVSGDGLQFLVALNQVGGNNPELMTWDEAMRRYGDVLPTKSQAWVMAKNYETINAAIIAFGGDKDPEGWYWTKTEYGASHAWGVAMYSGIVVYTTKTSAGGVRAVAPVPASR